MNTDESPHERTFSLLLTGSLSPHSSSFRLINRSPCPSPVSTCLHPRRRAKDGRRVWGLVSTSSSLERHRHRRATQARRGHACRQRRPSSGRLERLVTGRSQRGGRDEPQPRRERRRRSDGYEQERRYLGFASARLDLSGLPCSDRRLSRAGRPRSDRRTTGAAPSSHRAVPARAAPPPKKQGLERVARRGRTISERAADFTTGNASPRTGLGPRQAAFTTSVGRTTTWRRSRSALRVGQVERGLPAALPAARPRLRPPPLLLPPPPRSVSGTALRSRP